MDELVAEPAPPELFEAGMWLVFQHLDPKNRVARTVEALRLLRQEELDSDALWIVRQGGQVIAAMVWTAVPGASGLVWPPQTTAGPLADAAEDVLVRAAIRSLRGKGVRLAQALLAPAEAPLGAPLLRHGFEHLTRLWYLRHYLPSVQRAPQLSSRLSLQTYAQCDHRLFHATLLRTYEQTLDCPELNGVRTLAEILEGHQAQGRFRPDHWWLALQDGQPAGVLLLAEMTEYPAWDLSYLGVVPEARRTGVGRDLTLLALHAAQQAGGQQLTLCVDERNRPAQSLYRGLEFETVESREVFLAIWDPASSCK